MSRGKIRSSEIFSALTIVEGFGHRNSLSPEISNPSGVFITLLPEDFKVRFAASATAFQSAVVNSCPAAFSFTKLAMIFRERLEVEFRVRVWVLERASRQEVLQMERIPAPSPPSDFAGHPHFLSGQT